LIRHKKYQVLAAPLITSYFGLVTAAGIEIRLIDFQTPEDYILYAIAMIVLVSNANNFITKKIDGRIFVSLLFRTFYARKGS
jgi:hypothetical protein